MNESINYGGVCRTAPATPGLLKIGQTTVNHIEVCCQQSNRPNHLQDYRNMKDFSNVTSEVANLFQENIWMVTVIEHILELHFSVILVRKLLGKRGVWERTLVFFPWQDWVMLQQMYIQRKNSTWLTKTCYIDTWRQGSPMRVVWLQVYSEISRGKAH